MEEAVKKAGVELASGSLVIISRCVFILLTGAMLLGPRDMFREQDETAAQLQELDAVARLERLSCGVCAGLRLVEIVALSIHVSDSTLLVCGATQKAKVVSLTSEEIG